MRSGFIIVSDPGAINRGKWSEFILNHENGNVFQTPEYFDLCNSIPEYSGVVLFCNKGDEIFGALVSVIQREFSGILGKVTARSVILGGPLVKDNDPEIASLLITEYNKGVRSKALFSQFRNLRDMSSFGDSFSTNGYGYEDHLDIHINLSKGEDLLWKEMYSIRRWEVKRSMKHGVQVLLVDPEKQGVMESCYDLLKLRYKKEGLPLPKIDYFRNAAKYLGENGIFRLFIAEVDSKIIGFMMTLCFKEVMYDWYMAVSDKDSDKFPNALFLWKAFLWGIDNEYKIFDFGGAGKPDKPYGVREYKKKFGGEIVNFGRYEIVHKKVLYAIVMGGFKIRKMIIKKNEYFT